MIGKRLFFCIFALILSPVPCFAQSDSYCKNFVEKMDASSLYVATCLGGASCLEKVSKSTGAAMLEGPQGPHLLKKGQTYRFLYKINLNQAINSLVIVQLKRTALLPAKDPKTPDVQLKRFGMTFACYRSQKGTASLNAWPPDVQNRTLYQSIKFQNYDQFHRYGFTAADDDKMLRRVNQFHVLYFNGRTCVSTLESSRLPQFLIEDRQNIPWRIEGIFRRLTGWVGNVTATAAEKAQKYDRLKILVSSYSNLPDAPGCFSFPARAGNANSSNLEILISDVEQQAQTPFDLSESWSFDLQ